MIMFIPVGQILLDDLVGDVCDSFGFAIEGMVQSHLAITVK